MAVNKDNRILFWIMGIILFGSIFLIIQEKNSPLSEPIYPREFNNDDLLGILSNALEKSGYGENTLNLLTIHEEADLSNLNMFEESPGTCKLICDTIDPSDCFFKWTLAVCDGGEDGNEIINLVIEIETSEGNMVKRTYNDRDYYVIPSWSTNVNGFYIPVSDKFFVLFSAQENDNIIEGYIDTYFQSP